MKYSEFANTLIKSVGGTDNILKIKRKNNKIIVKLWDDTGIQLNTLNSLPIVKSVELTNMEFQVKLRYRDVSYAFEALKELPNSVVTVIPPPEEEINDKPFWQRLAGSIYGDIFPLILAMMLGGYLVGIVTFIGRMFG